MTPVNAPKDPLHAATAIRRTQPLGERSGFALPAFVHNGWWFLAAVEVYEDGAIFAWDGLDRALFDRKLDQGWVDPQPPDGAWLGLGDLGACVCRDPDWRLTPKDLRAAVDLALARLGPPGRRLVDLDGDPYALRPDGMRVAKLSLPDTRPRRGPVDGRRIEVLRRERDDAVSLVGLTLWGDALAQVDGEEAAPADAVLERLASGDLRTSAPDGARVTIPGLGSFTLAQSSWSVRRAERVREARALLAELGGADDPVRACRDAHARYAADPTDARREALRAAYEAVPRHLRMYCGDMDTKDSEIRRILRRKGGIR